jgi:hypothetical protein
MRNKTVIVAVMIGATFGSLMLAIIALYLGLILALYVLRTVVASDTAAMILSLAVGAVCAVLTVTLCIRLCWSYCRRKPTEEKPSGKYARIAYFSLAGATPPAALMLVGTLLLGHTRPPWMELSYALPAGVVGLLVGSILGIAAELNWVNTAGNARQ